LQGAGGGAVGSSSSSSSANSCAGALLEVAHEHLNSIEVHVKAAATAIRSAADKLMTLPFSLEDIELREKKWRDVSTTTMQRKRLSIKLLGVQ
jgi:hypothetical protein